ncbi:MAG: phosphate transport system regulatory protein PhoU [Desulfobacteraceae bacterium]|nr:MAG: phosphate transport system regulatory protein PhoU [Desulfobacteraceae bacterium]
MGELVYLFNPEKQPQEVNMEKHTIRRFDRKLSDLRDDVVHLGHSCEKQITSSIDSLNSQDIGMAKEIIANDQKINRQHDQIEKAAIGAIVKWQPAAIDLRFLISVMKISGELERIGDYAANIAKRTIRMNDSADKESLELISEMADQCCTMLNNSIHSFQDDDVDAAISVWHQDDDIDSLFKRSMNLITKAVGKTGDLTGNYSNLIFVARCCERIGDHIKNVAENITYIHTGELYNSTVQ